MVKCVDQTARLDAAPLPAPMAGRYQMIDDLIERHADDQIAVRSGPFISDLAGLTLAFPL